MPPSPTPDPRHASDPKSKRSIRLGFVGITLAVAVLIGLALIEGGLRVFDLPRTDKSFRFLHADNEVDELFAASEGVFVYDKDWLWRLDPNTRAYIANHLGLRGFAPTREKGARDFRIACVGDSCTFGFGVRLEDTYAMRIERALQTEHPELCVTSINAGLVGHSTQQNSIVYRNAIAPLRPDVSVFYVGTWNDHLPSVGLSDAQRYASRDAWRISRVMQRVLGVDKSADAATEDALQAFRDGKAPFGRRVSPVEFRANLQSMLDDARRIGSEAVFVLPPLPEQTLAKKPESLEYRDLVAEFAREHEVQVIDGPTIFRKFCEASPEPREMRSLFLDWAHPTAEGHGLLADALLDFVRARVARLAPSPAAVPRLRLVGCTPSEVRMLAAGHVELSGEGFAQPDAFDRVWIDGRWAPVTTIVADDRLRVQLPLLPPGEHRIEFVTRDGVLQSDVTLRVARPEATDAPRFEATLAGTADAPTLTVRCEVPPTAWVAAWWSLVVRAEPILTQHGAFSLDDGSAPQAHLDPTSGDYRFDQLALPRQLGPVMRDGVWQAQFALDPTALRAGQAIHVQGLVFDYHQPTTAVLSAVF